MLSSSTGNNYTTRQIIVALTIIFFCCLIANWPVSAGMFGLKNDAVRYFLPVRYQISEMILNGQFPFWTPYLNLGHPLYTDMQSGVWNPFVWLITLFGSYTMRSLQAELLIYVYLSGVSMFFLLKYFKLNRTVSLALAISYMLCGFISDSSQFAYWVCGTAFLPFVFLYFLKALREPSFRSALFLSFSFYLLFVTGYPGEFIIIFYFLLSYFILYLFQNKKPPRKAFRFIFASVIIFCLFSLPALISYLSGLNYITRGSSISLELVLSNSMHPFNLISYFFPLAVWKLPISETDILGRNSFLGLLPFILILLSFYMKTKNSLITFLKWVFILSIFLSLGKYGFLRSVTFYILPYMDTFRHPSMFRFLTIFCGILIAAITLNNLVEKQDTNSKKGKAFWIIISLMIFSSIAILIMSSSDFFRLLPASFSTSDLKSWLDQSSIKNWLILELLIQIPFLILIYRYFVKKINLNIVLAITVVNSIIHIIFLQPVTVVSTETVSSFESKINSLKVEGFPFPDLQASILSNSMMEENTIPNFGPVNMFNKKHGFQFGFITPGPLILHEKFMNTKNLHQAVFNFPLLYRADTTILSKDSLELPSTKRFVLTDDPALITYINSTGKDTLYNFRILRYNPAVWEFEVSNSVPGFFSLNQNHYPKWELTVNEKKEEIYLCNLSMIGFKLQPGKNIVKFEFRDNKVMYAFYLQLLLWLLILAYFIYMIIKRIKN